MSESILTTATTEMTTSTTAVVAAKSGRASGGNFQPRLVASSLERLEIPHNDGLGHIVPGIFESAEWQAWIELQRAPHLNSFLRFLNALPDPAVLSPKISRQIFEKILREGYKEVLLDDLELLREFCAARVDEKPQSAAAALRVLPFLPPHATLAQFLEQTQAALAHLGWKQHALEIANDTEFGLTGAIYTKSRDKIDRAKRDFQVGNLYINRKCTGAMVGAHPFGGFNMSGTDSKSGGPDYLYLFTQAKSIAEKA